MLAVKIQNRPWTAGGDASRSPLGRAAGSLEQDVVAWSAVEDVQPEAAVQDVVAGFAVKSIVAGAAD